MLEKIQHIVVLMLENRSFDHMLGFLYAESNNTSPTTGQPFEGLTGSETCPDSSGNAVQVFRIDPTHPYAYFMPGADPGEGLSSTNNQLFGSVTAPTPPVATNQGFVADFAYTLGWQQTERWSILPGTTASSIMGIFPPTMLPVLSGLARGYAVCDHWFGSVPTETMPNRAFACAATSQGRVDDKVKSFTSPSIFGLLSANNQSWSIYGYDAPPLTRQDFPDTLDASSEHFGELADFQKAAASGTLASFTFLEPSWSSAGNSQHPNYNVALGEQLIHDVYYALRNGPAWNETLLIITYDEHGGCYDHVPPPTNAVPPDDTPGEDGFDFRRFGLRVPTVLVSPLIAEGTVFRVPGPTPLDHTSILRTVENRWNLQPLTARDAAAPDVSAVLTLPTPRTDDPLQAVVVPTSRTRSPHSPDSPPSHLERIHAELVSRLPVPDAQGGHHHVMPTLKTSAELQKYVRERTKAWEDARSRHPHHRRQP
jgi:phospholipase C